jgi:hypothetical protein
LLVIRRSYQLLYRWWSGGLKSHQARSHARCKIYPILQYGWMWLVLRWVDPTSLSCENVRPKKLCCPNKARAKWACTLPTFFFVLAIN